MENRWTDRAALMVLTGLMTAYLRGFVEPPGDGMVGLAACSSWWSGRR
jgi:hypothetical protein